MSGDECNISDGQENTDSSEPNPVLVERERRSIEKRGVGTVHEAGRDSQFVSSPSGTVHKRELINEDIGHALDPVCGQSLTGTSLWSGYDAETAKEVAEKYAEVSFCSNCFNKSLHLERLGREARR